MHPKQHIADLPAILRQQGVTDIVISPGSRNAPLINSFLKEFGNRCHSIIDERSAAYVALGMASCSGKPVALLCTSGTAALNYAPAVAEAFHQGVPLIAVTADRPPEWIDQQDNQTIRQAGIYAGNVKAVFTMPVEIQSEADLWHARRMAHEAINTAVSGRPGPIQFNVPLREPLYEELPAAAEASCIRLTTSAAFEEPTDRLKGIWKKARNILVVAGQQPINEPLSRRLEQLCRDPRICIIGEPASNLRIRGVIRNPDLLLAMDEEQPDPDLLIWFGGQVVSKRLKQFLRRCRVKAGWFIDTGGRHVDTFQHLTDVVQADPLRFFEWLTSVEGLQSSDYRQQWQEHADRLDARIRTLPGDIEYSDLGIIRRISAALPGESVLFAGNSTIIRMIGFFPPLCREIFSNRGTSGIDGCVSTAVGVAMASETMVIALVGDQSFVYDSNALWNRSLPENLKIIVINNQGGGIFGLLDGPSATPAYESFLVAHHPAGIRELAAAFGVSYHVCRQYDDFDTAFERFIRGKGPSVFEIITPHEVNNEVFRNFVNLLKKKE